VDLSFEGHLIDFTGCGASSVPLEQRNGFLEERTFPKQDAAVRIHLDGIIYTTVFNPSDGRKNWQDLISAFVWAFRDSPDATLVLKVIHYDFEEARKVVTDEVLKLVPFECRVVVLHGYLNGREYAKLIRQSTYVVNASYGEGQCLPLMEAMSAGKPAISPVHTAMEDYVTQSNCFVIRSSAERAWWPHDPRRAFRTTRYRIDWESLRSAYLESFHVAKHDSVRYARMASSAVESLRGFCSKALAEERLRSLFRECGIANDDPRAARRNLWRTTTRAVVRVWRLVVVPKIRSLRTDMRTKIARLQADADAS
jgi:glycosyltransferase involved in cell wall biosynthesis